jgi:acetylxylan esterase
VRRSPSQSYSVKGGRNYTGIAPRSSEQLAGLKPYAEILRDYCNNGDPICAVNSTPVDLAQHLNYFKLYNDEAADFIVRTAKGEHVEIAHENATEIVTPSNTKAVQATSTPTSASSGRTVRQMAVWFMAFGVISML